MGIAVSKRRFTADDYERMAETGILSDDDRVELIDGEVVVMTPIGALHAANVDRANHVFRMKVGATAIIRVQSPVRLNLYTEPQPDLVLLRPRDDFYAKAHPGPSDILLIVEVADSSLDYDRDVKTFIYAQSAIVEYWLVDLNSRGLVRHTSPDNGSYKRVDQFTAGQAVAPQLLPGCHVQIADLIGY
jgi:Uma2 family endonuclease